MIYVSYSVLTLLSFALHKLLNQIIIAYVSSTVSLFFFGLSFYLFFGTNGKDLGPFFLTWWTYFILTYIILRRQFVKENHAEPIFTKGTRYDFDNGRKAYYGDYIFTLSILILPSALSYGTALLVKACS